MKRIISGLAVFAVLCCALSYPAFADDSTKVIETEIENDFIPDHLQTDTQRNITREEFCATVVSLYEYISETQAKLPAENPFTDTDNSDVLKAFQLGIVQGCGNGLFMPKQELNVEQKAVMLYNALILLDPSIDSDLSQGTEGSHYDFNDASSVSAWAVEAIEYLYHHAIINDDKDKNINPIDPVTVDSANSHAQITLEHYTDLITLTDSEKYQILNCSAKDTLVTMSDGSVKLISEIKVGDEILSMKNSSARVVEVISGEEAVVRIVYGDDGYISLTQKQPLMTVLGLKRAYDLTQCDELIDKDGNSVEVKFVYRLAYKSKLYHLMLDNNYHMFIANGVFIGDFDAQNSMEPKSRDN